MRFKRFLAALCSAVCAWVLCGAIPLSAAESAEYALFTMSAEYSLTLGETLEITLEKGLPFAVRDSAGNVYMAIESNLSAPFTDAVLKPMTDGGKWFFVLENAGTYQVTLNEGDGCLLLTVGTHQHAAQTHVTPADDPCANEPYDLCECGAILRNGKVTDRSDETLFAHIARESITKQPTCTETGTADEICSVCGFAWEKVLPMRPHMLTHIEAGADTRIPQEHWYCTLCENSYADEACTEKIAGGTAIGMSGSYDNITWQIENGVLTIAGKGALNGDPALDGSYPWTVQRDLIFSVVIGDGITALGDFAFAEMTSVASISIPDSVTAVGKCCFDGASSLTTLSLPASVREIGIDTCSGCTSLRSVSLPGVEVIPEWCFRGCTALSDVTLSDSLRRVASDAFFGCAALLTDGDLVTVGSVLYAYTGSEHIVHIPEGITVVADGAFRMENRVSSKLERDDRLIAVFCPESLRYIGAEAFRGSVQLAEIVLPEGLCEIGENAFAECRSLKTVTIPESVTAVGAQQDCALTAVIGNRGSAAEQLAQESGIAFRDIDRLPSPIGFDPATDGWAFGNSGAAFGSSYDFTERDRGLVDALDTVGLDAMNGAWSGSCFGLSLSVLLAKHGLIDPNVLQPGAKTLSEVEATPEIVSMINYYHAIQYSSDFLRSAPSSAIGETAAQMIWRLLRTADSTPQLLDLTTKTGRHAMLAYGAESGKWEWDGKAYDARVTVWDSNFPAAVNERSCVYIDSRTLDYCIPQYGVTVTEGETAVGGINTVCGDTDILNVYPYPFAGSVQPGDIDCNGAINIADAVLLMRLIAEDAEAVVTVRGRAAADIDGDGLVTLTDARVLLCLLANTPIA